MLKITENGASDPALASMKSKGATKLSVDMESQPSNVLTQGGLNNQSQHAFKLRKVQFRISCSLSHYVEIEDEKLRRRKGFIDYVMMLKMYACNACLQYWFII